MRLISLSLGSLLLLVLSLLAVRFWGQNQVYSPFKNDWFERPYFHVLPEDKVLSQQKSEIDWIAWLEVDETDSLKLRVQNLLAQKSQQRFILNITKNRENIHSDVVKVLTDLKVQNQIVIQSPVHVIITSIKSLLPMTAYGLSRAEMTRLNVYSSLGVLPAVSIKADVFISPLKVQNMRPFNESILAELKRRHKKIILGPLSTVEEIELAKNYYPDGLFITEPSLLQK